MYKIQYIINVSIDADDREFITIPECPKSFDLKVNFIKLSARYKNHPKFEVHNNILDLINNKTSVLKKKSHVLFIFLLSTSQTPLNCT